MDCTIQMLLITLKFKIAFSAYSERNLHYTYTLLHEDWGKVQKVCKLLVFNIATHIISVNKYFTTNLYLGEL